MAEKKDEALDVELPQIITISWDEDGALEVDSGDNMGAAEVLGTLFLAAFQEAAVQVIESLGFKLPED